MMFYNAEHHSEQSHALRVTVGLSGSEPSRFDGLTQRNLEVRAKEEGSAGRRAMKKLINGPETGVTDALAGIAAAHPPGPRWGR
jgi:hypothetical protein